MLDLFCQEKSGQTQQVAQILGGNVYKIYFERKRESMWRTKEQMEQHKDQN
jgi:hypothetical protein